MQVGILGVAVYLSHDFGDYLIREIESGVELPRIHTIAPNNHFSVLLTPPPRVRVCGRIDLKNHPNPHISGIFDDLFPYVRERVGPRDAAELTQLRHRVQLQRKAVLVDDVPVQDIEFVVQQRAHYLFDESEF